jgi:hypothetical protein
MSTLLIYECALCIRGCSVDVSPTDVSPTESSWMLRPLKKASLGYCVPDRCVPTLDEDGLTLHPLEYPIPSKYLFLWSNLASITIYPYNEANIRGEEKTVHVVFK